MKKSNRPRQCLIIYLLVFFSINSILAQKKDYVIIDKITLKGHQKTKDKIILRELDFKVGDSLIRESMEERFKRNQEMLVNSSLFKNVTINIGNWDYEARKVEIVIKTDEAWYIYPFGWVSLADRNFNVWWTEKNHSLARLNYQVGLRWNNLTGHRDLIRVSTEFGFGRKYEVDYKIPGINKKRTIGFFLNTLYSKNKEIWYATQKDSLQIYRNDDNYQIHRFRLLGGYTFRPKLRTTHAIQFAFFKNEISAIVAREKNADFFLNGRTEQRYFSLNYKFTKDRRSNKFYPQRGSFFTLNIEKDGLFSKKEDVQALYATVLYAKFLPVFKDKIDYEAILKGRKEFTGKPQPYYNTRALGYLSDYLRGYEYYVIDGADYAYFKNSFRVKLLKKTIDFGEFVPPGLRYFPTNIWLSINNDFGYVRNKNKSADNQLPNQFLWGRGIGLNIKVFQFSYYQVEISQNHLNKIGFFIHAKLPLE